MRAGAVFAALADPDRQPPRERTLAYLAWGGMLSLGLHLALLTWLNTLPFSLGGPARIALEARLTPPAREQAVPVPAAVESPVATPPEVPRPAPSAPSAPTPPPKAEAASAIPDRYFASGEVDVPAELVEKPPLVYPENPYLWKLGGAVRLRLFIGLDGRVESVELLSAEPAGHFEDAALIAARGIKYRPALLRGQPVRSRRTIEIVFDPHEHIPGRSPAGK